MDRYMMETRNKLVLARLIAEGAVCVFENEASPLYHLGMRNGMEEAAKGFDMVGAALTELRYLSRAMLDEHRKACAGEDEKEALK